MEELIKKLEEQDKKIDAIYKSVEKTRKYMRNSIIVTLLLIIVPLIFSLALIPSFISAINSSTSGLSGF